jgi:hypothetical protein
MYQFWSLKLVNLQLTIIYLENVIIDQTIKKNFKMVLMGAAVLFKY